MNFQQALPSSCVLATRFSAPFRKPKQVSTQLPLNILQQSAVATIVLSFNSKASSTSMFPDIQSLELERNTGLDF